MMFNISAFTHVGTERRSNQDSILVNGLLLNKGEVLLPEQDSCFCFVADGVGGNRVGEFASNFVLEKLKILSDTNTENLEQLLVHINELLLCESQANIKIKGTATTLTGLVCNDDAFKIIHAGDSQIWLLRDDMFFKITTDQVLSENEPNSPITSYFGGTGDYLTFDTGSTVNEALIDDVFLICSDGLFKSINIKFIKSILKVETNWKIITHQILENCLQSGAPDNISIILIQRIN